MSKVLSAALGAAFALVSFSASAGESGNGFFVNAGVGQAQYHVGRTDGLGYRLDDKDTAGAVRFGYLWHSAVDFGVEAGYVDLGKLVASYEDNTFSEHFDIGAHGWLAGVNGRYVFGNHWFLSARGGWFRTDARATYRYRDAVSTDYVRENGDGNGWYGGVGAGYDFSPQFSLGLNYDNYHGKAGNSLYRVHDNVGTFMVSAEYRF